VTVAVSADRRDGRRVIFLWSCAGPSYPTVWRPISANLRPRTRHSTQTPSQPHRTSFLMVTTHYILKRSVFVWLWCRCMVCLVCGRRLALVAAAIAKAQPISRFHSRDADREMDGFPWNGQFSVKFCNFARSLIHFLNIFPMPVLCSAFAITFTQIINNYLLKCNPFALCLLTVQQSSDVTLNMEAERSVSQYTAANSAQRQWLSMSKCNLANQVIIAKNSKTANNWAEKLVVATDKLN